MRKLKLLWVAPEVPFPTTSGGRAGVYFRMEELARRGHSISFYATVDTAEELEPPQELLTICRDVHLFPRNKGIGTFIRAPFKPYYVMSRQNRAMQVAIREALETERYDAVQVDHANMAPYVLGTKHTPVVLTAHNLDHRLFFANARHSHRLSRRSAFWFEAKKIEAFERRLFASSNLSACVFVSQTEFDWVNQSFPQLNSHWIPLGARTDRRAIADGKPYLPAVKEGPLAVFVGKMSFDPNVVAVRWFVEEVWPTIREAIPGAKFLIVGADPSPQVRALGNVPGVEVVGEVPDTFPYLAAADCVVIPVQSGAGIKMKLLEALGLSKPVITTPLGYAGLPLQPGLHLISASTASDFSSACIEVLREPNRFQAMANAGYEVVRQGYSWARVVEQYEELYDDVLKLGRGS